MVRPVAMPKLGQSEEEATIVRWFKKEGERVTKGEILFEIETDKALLEVESFQEGTLLKILVPEGETVPVQSTIGYIGEPGEPIPVAPALAKPAKKVSAPEHPAEAAEISRPAGGIRSRPSREVVEAPSAEQAALEAPLPTTKEALSIFRISPRAARLAKEAGIDPSPIAGTGPGGRVVERDVTAYLKAQGYDQLRLTPAAKKLAVRENIDILKLPSQGQGRITVADVRAAMAERPTPLNRMRQVIAERLSQSYRTAPHYFVTVSVDVTDLAAFRAELKAQGKAYTLTDFIVKAVALTLVDFPVVNSTTDGKSLRWHSRVDVGLAASMEQGLVVPVIRDADQLSLEEIHAAATELTARARAGRLNPADMTGSTFTISNMGMMDVENFTAIINPGESAILAVSSAQQKPVVKDEQVVIRTIMKMTLASDHRLIDGAVAARFINAVRQRLEETILWKRLA
ncbi:MAG: 2-oxo acid dehydrogenase subunit E2 [Acidobacteriia bacterium]|nr:2-oxo acid dehydrogenase subunit E2 [Terriglobia bacterium]